MKHLWGLQEQPWRRGEATPVVMNTDRLINGHMLIAGMSGTGKSYQIMQLLSACAREGILTDVFDVHEELHEARSCTAAKFSAATRIGYNPLVVNTDPHSGGPVNQINFVLDIINRTSTKLGPRQERALHSLIGDLYWRRGIYPDNQNSWRKKEITEHQWAQAKAARQFHLMQDCYPTLGDLLDLAERKLKQLTLGTENRCINALDKVMATASKIQALMTRYNKSSSDEEVERLQGQLERDKQAAIEYYAEFVRHIELGREYQDASRFTSSEVLQSVIDRIKSIHTIGIFCSNPPQWKDSTIRVYQIGSLRDDERRLLFYNRAAQILRECMDAGKQDTLKRIILVDEGHLYYSEDGDNPLNRIAKEGRKFGLGLVVGSQSPTHFSEDFLTNCGTVALLGIHENFWDMAVRKLRIDRQVLLSTKPRETIALKMHAAGEAGSRFELVNVNSAAVMSGINAIKQQRGPGQAQPTRASIGGGYRPSMPMRPAQDASSETNPGQPHGGD